MKKCLAVVLALLMLVSTFQIVGFAEKADAAVGETDVVTKEEIKYDANNDNYGGYLDSKSNYADAKKDIFIAAGSYKKANAKLELVKEVEDQEGVKKNNVLKWTGEKGSVTYTFKVDEPGFYEIELSYMPIVGRGLPLSFAFKIDGEYPYEVLNSVNFERTWVDSKPEGVSDGNGNVYSSEQIEKFLFISRKATDRNGQYADPLKVALDAGVHTIELTALSGELYLAGVTLAAPDEVINYKDYIAKYNKGDYYEGKELQIEGEAAKYKSTASLNPLIDNSDPSVNPTAPFKELVNYIGSTGWQTPGETITWEVDVPEDGLYKFGFRYRQNVVINGNSYRALKVDGVAPFKEADSVAFAYGGNWQFTELSIDTGKRYEKGKNKGERIYEPAYVYLTKGTHQLSLTVTLGEMGEISQLVNEITYEVGDLYLKMKMITGEKIDPNRSYEFFEKIPGFNETLQTNIDKLLGACERITEITGEESTTYSATMKNMARVMQKMLDDQFRAQKYVNDYYTQYCSLAALVSDLAEMPVDIDQIILAAPKKDYEKTLAKWPEKFVYGCERLITSFMDDYRYTTTSEDGRKVLTLWVTWGRDQTQILTSLVKDSFETEHPDVKVNVQIVGASLIQAILLGEGPDLLLGQPRSEPVNYGMRNALVNLKQFDDYEEVIKRFQPSATVPYTLGNAVYGIPDTQSFNIMFYRTDIFEEMNLEVPRTWDEFRDVTALLQRQNLQAGFGAPQSADLGVIDGFSTFLKQSGAQLYNDDLTATAISDGTAIERFVFWTEFFTNLGYEESFDFYNRFRSGTMPIGVSGYGQYVLFSQAAPEITGKWSIAKAPGTMQPDGTINYTQADSGTACVIPRITHDKELAWEFLKWWTSDNIQYRYSTMVEAILGEVGRVNTANIEALKRLPWQSNDLDILLDAWSHVDALEQVPGGYYVARSIYQAFWNTVNLKENPKDMIVRWGKIADQEIERKREEYADELAKHYN
ncbi:MAG: extracellular solute-binding protein [Clostridia bacterium]|nr:extracellular solute-binding protein [Clostridia bacterium]